MEVEQLLRLENNQVGNTWYSDDHNKPTFQLHISRELYLALGSPEVISVTIGADDD